MADPHGPEGEEGENGEHAGWRFRGRAETVLGISVFITTSVRTTAAEALKYVPKALKPSFFLVALFTELFLHKMLKIIVTLNTGLLVYLMIDVTK